MNFKFMILNASQINGTQASDRRWQCPTSFLFLRAFVFLDIISEMWQEDEL